MIDRPAEMTPNEVDAVNAFTRRARKERTLEADLVAAQRLEQMGYPLVAALRVANRAKVGLSQPVR